ncbi:MAG: SET domain-containing protein-lysine N-methyltransferase [Candidatus Tectomicrobia bacterium]|nr:SET domain-containing protein-lysine N-methyltransferase [Candidatus Tectomicrobia bacterium]
MATRAPAVRIRSIPSHCGLWFYALRRIRPGEELTYNYSHELEGYQGRPCHCGAPDCVGYMVAEEFFETVRRRQGQRSGKLRR